ncbi:unnamed protein product [Ilex paraguariensis]|uniref:Uncharacterized protein n=1 Tax=Ilex paraguariensis TaxID=185542 RepID=A0ABC8RRD2_9AQUA
MGKPTPRQLQLFFKSLVPYKDQPPGQNQTYQNLLVHLSDMVFLVQRLSHSIRQFSKLDNHHHHSEASSASLQTFRSHVSNCLNQLSLDSKPGFKYWSLPWIHRCFKLLPVVNEAFAKLAVDMDYPMSKWEAISIEEYFQYSLNLLEHLNSIRSALAHLSQARVSLSHALSLVENSPSLAMEYLRKIQSKKLRKEFEMKGIEEREDMPCSGKELVVHEALTIVKNIETWVCGIVLSGLCSDAKPYMMMRKSAALFVDSSLKALDSSVCREIEEKQGVLKEFKEVNDAVDCLVEALDNGEAHEAVKELEGRLEVIEMVLQCIGKELDCLFSNVLAGRDELIEILRQKSQ